MPGAIVRTSILVLTNLTLSYVLAIADKGVSALQQDPQLSGGLNIHVGIITYKAVSILLNCNYIELLSAIGIKLYA
jgi:alanine dehydrogenase